MLFTKYKLSGFLFGMALMLSSCVQTTKEARKEMEKGLISFKPFFGISYTEVHRRMANGLSFNQYGYQLKPEWRMRFISNDSISIYSPDKKRFLNFPVSRGYDSIFNTARTWLRARKMTKDSLLLEILIPRGDSLDIKGAKVYMTFYANNYIKNVLHTDAEKLKHPSKKDTLFVKDLVQASIKDYKKAFAATEPVKFISKTPTAEAKQQVTEATIFNQFNPEDYLNPAFDITVKKAYANFFYTFTMIVDEKGDLHYGKPLIAFTEEQFKQSYIRTSQAIMNGYLKAYFDIVSGKTLNMAHSSEVTINIRGIK